MKIKKAFLTLNFWLLISLSHGQKNKFPDYVITVSGDSITCKIKDCDLKSVSVITPDRKSTEYKAGQVKQFAFSRNDAKFETKKVINKEGLLIFLPIPGLKDTIYYNNADYIISSSDKKLKVYHIVNREYTGSINSGVGGNLRKESIYLENDSLGLNEIIHNSRRMEDEQYELLKKYLSDNAAIKEKLEKERIKLNPKKLSALLEEYMSDSE